MRMKIFQDNLRNIKEHNEKFKKGEVSYEKGENKFADLTRDEFIKRFTGLKIPGEP